ncbi:putative fimbrial chaperone YadV [compost metagenome]
MEAPKELRWRLVRQGAKAVLEVTNNSAFHISLAEVKLQNGNRSYAVDSNMVAPRSSRQFDIRAFSPGASSAGMKVEFQSVNDYGGVDKHSSPLID